jgi:hypothetical protein
VRRKSSGPVLTISSGLIGSPFAAAEALEVAGEFIEAKTGTTKGDRRDVTADAHTPTSSGATITQTAHSLSAPRPGHGSHGHHYLARRSAPTSPGNSPQVRMNLKQNMPHVLKRDVLPDAANGNARMRLNEAA